MEPIFFVNGQYVPQSEATISVEHLGLHRALGVFDLFRSIDGRPRFFNDYLERFDKSQQFLQLGDLVRKEQLHEVISNLQVRNRFPESTFKLILLGSGVDGDPEFKPNLIALNLPFDGTRQPKSIGVITHEYRREYPEVKSLNYLTSFSLQKKKHDAGASEVIFHKDGFVTEASRCNLFVIQDGIVLTPDTDILRGITRKHVIAALKPKMEIREEPVSLAQLQSAQEVFLTSTTKEIMPVTKIDGKEIGGGNPGLVTTRMQRLFHEYIHDLPRDHLQ